MSDYFDDEGTTTIGEHEMYPVAVSSEFREGHRERHPDRDHDDLIAGRCEDCDTRWSGSVRGFDAAVREHTCPPGQPERTTTRQLPDGRELTFTWSGVSQKPEVNNDE